MQMRYLLERKIEQWPVTLENAWLRFIDMEKGIVRNKRIEMEIERKRERKKERDETRIN